ncbi:protein FAM177A1 [Bombyx mori]|uniref:Protein FAM177A1 n=1 Tax=Bombyx mori TaxID=7091 RepID=A0A8R2ALR9_BOMMO|nr:protein FAM177A1 [Bombyx mori]
MASNENSQIKLNIQPTRVLHFSDGVDEIVEEEEVNELKNEPKEANVDPKTLSWLPWLTHYANTSGTKVLNAIDYTGESLANFFGITTPKYQLEIDEYERLKEEKKKMEDESAGWVPKNSGGDIPLVLNEPGKDVTRQEA